MFCVISDCWGHSQLSTLNGEWGEAEVPFRRPQTRGQGTIGTQLSPGARLFIEEAVHFVFRLQEGCIQVSGVEGFLDLLYGCMITTKYDI